MLDVVSVSGATAFGLANPNSRTEHVQNVQKHIQRLPRSRTLLFMLGEVDCGYLIWLRAQAGASVEDEMNASLRNYTDFLQRLRDNGRGPDRPGHGAATAHDRRLRNLGRPREHSARDSSHRWRTGRAHTLLQPRTPSLVGKPQPAVPRLGARPRGSDYWARRSAVPQPGAASTTISSKTALPQWWRITSPRLATTDGLVFGFEDGANPERWSGSE